MYTPPPHLDDRELLHALHVGWGFKAVSVRYAAVGFGSHHWIATDSTGSKRFVTVDDLSKIRVAKSEETVLARLTAAFETARALKDNGLDFVVAPLGDKDGRVLRRLADSFSIAVFPFLDGHTPSDGEWQSDDERQVVLALLGELHQATQTVADVANSEDFVLPCRSELNVALGELGLPWASGPFSEPARQLLHRIEPDLVAAMELFDGLVDDVRSDKTPWVVTHGEPHAANIVWTAAGPQLIDWDTALIAPAGRDRWMLGAPGGQKGGTENPAMILYRLWWDLAEIATYVGGFRVAHDTTADTAESWRNLEHFAQLREHWGDQLDNG
jgi:spectinomycin phosphotransferase